MNDYEVSELVATFVAILTIFLSVPIGIVVVLFWITVVTGVILSHPEWFNLCFLAPPTALVVSYGAIRIWPAMTAVFLSTNIRKIILMLTVAPETWEVEGDNLTHETTGVVLYHYHDSDLDIIVGGKLADHSPLATLTINRVTRRFHKEQVDRERTAQFQNVDLWIKRGMPAIDWQRRP